MRGLGKVGRKKDENDLNALCADTEFLKSKTKKYTHTHTNTPTDTYLKVCFKLKHAFCGMK